MEAIIIGSDAYSGRLLASEWEVKPIPVSIGRGLVQQFHYAGGASNTATFLHGLFQIGNPECLGCAWWIPPTRTAANATYPKDWKAVIALSRLVVKPGVPKNACTYLMARSIRLIPASRWPCLVTYADEWRGHKGTIYKAANWTPMGRTKPEVTYTLHGRMVARKRGPKTFTNPEMLAMGCKFEGRHAKQKFVIIR